MKKNIFLGTQIIVGFLLIMFGLNKFLQFLPMVPMAPQMGEFMTSLYKTGYIFPISGVIQTVAGLAFILNKFTSLMAVLVMPIMINALLSHLFLDPSGSAAAAIIVLALIIIMVKQKDAYVKIFKA